MARQCDGWLCFRARLWLPLLFLAAYALNGRAVLSGDALAHLYLAASVWHHGSLDLRPYEAMLCVDGKLPYYAVEDRGRIRSIFSFLPGVLLAPVLALGEAVAPAAADRFAVWGMAGKVAASAFTFLAGSLLWLLLRGRVERGVALACVVAFWFASPLWAYSTSYQQHQPAIAFKLLGLWLLFGGSDDPRLNPARIFAGGLALGLAVLSRYQLAATLPGVAIVLLVLWWRTPARLVAFAAGGGLTAATLLLHNRIMTGSALDTGYVVYPWAVFGAPFGTTLVALMANPSHGLFLHSPWLLFMVPGLMRLVRECRRPAQVAPLWWVVGLAPWPLVAMYANYTGWFGGWSWGYRFLLDLLPEFALLAALGMHQLWARRAWRWIACALVAIGIAIQAIGALAWDMEWHAKHDRGTMPHQDWLWQVRHSQVPWYLARGRFHVFRNPVQLWSDPYASTGLYETEDWGGRRVVWTHATGASFLYVSPSNPPTLQLFPSPAAMADRPLAVGIFINGHRAPTAHLPPGQWTTIELPGVRFQHSTIITLHPSIGWEEPGGARTLGVAVELGR